MKKSGYIIVFVTVPGRKAAGEIIKAVLEKKLAACVNLISGAESFYWWEGRTRHSKEMLLIMKTVAKKFALLKKCVEERHPYEVPEIISAEIAEGNKEYLGWIEKYAG